MYGLILPHPPILIPDIGKQRLKEAQASQQAYKDACQRLKKVDFDTIVVITPHGQVGQASVPVYSGHVFEGNFAQFGQNKAVYTFKGDAQLALATIKDCDFASNCPATLLDHGALVPLHYIQAAGIKKPILPIAIAFTNLKKLFSFGQLLQQTAQRLGRKIAIVASADMSHRLSPDAPAGFSPRGKEFDQQLVELIKNYDVEGLLNFDPAIAEEAGQDALWSIAVLLGALDGLKVEQEVLSYEGPFGVGYMVAELKA